MVNYQLIALAINYYQSLGFNFVEVPWAVGQAAIDITRPPGAILFPFENLFLVASGEQGFLQLLLDNGLPQGRWGCVTPCFRGDVLDRYHQRYFLKVELIDTLDTSYQSLDQILDVCLGFFSFFVSCKVADVKSEDPTVICNKDIVSSDGVELGSYGIREHPDIGRWLYATGCAEPRLSLVIDDQRPKSQNRTF